MGEKNIFFMIKKTVTILGMFLFVFTSCSDSVETDAEKLAEMQCKSYELMEKLGKGESTMEESTALSAEMELYDKEMKTKYASAEEKQKFEEACLKAISRGCK